jgi:hypothetical protein
MDLSNNLSNNTTKKEDNVNSNLFLLDPLSVIIKLAILGNKPIGTKLLIVNNVIYFQEPGLFQPIARMFYKTNKTDLQYLLNPIQVACSTFLTKEGIQKYHRIKQLFIFAQNGLKNLMETYKDSSIITLCLKYYSIIITNHIEQKYNDTILTSDPLTNYYKKELVDKLNDRWTHEKIKIVLDIIAFLTHDPSNQNNVKTLETIMVNNDANTQEILSKFQNANYMV